MPCAHTQWPLLFIPVTHLQCSEAVAQSRKAGLQSAVPCATPSGPFCLLHGLPCPCCRHHQQALGAIPMLHHKVLHAGGTKTIVQVVGLDQIGHDQQALGAAPVLPHEPLHAGEMKATMNSRPLEPSICFATNSCTRSG
eukprot:1156454-Pelagomonas_calceolata.AAC.8